MKNKAPKATIMLVDDTPANLRYLQEILLKKDYRVVAFTRGDNALKAASHNPPDIILLDILMPDMNGYEVCKRLKDDPALKKIPVLFLSALSDTQDKNNAFAQGGVDYITKPFDDQEVLRRVETHLRLYRLTQQLEKIVREQTDELSSANEALEKEIGIRKEAEARILANNVMLQAVFEGIPEPLMLLDPDMHVRIFNNSASAYYAAIGNPISQGKHLCHDFNDAHPDICAACSLPEAVAKREDAKVERKGIGNPDRIEQVLLHFIEEHGRKTGQYIMRIADITEERRLSQEMAQIDKLIALGTVVAGVAHEINNPNHVILLNAPIVAEIWQNVDPILDRHLHAHGDFAIGKMFYSQMKQDIPVLIADIASSGKRIKRIVEVLKNFSAKSDSLVLAAVDINEAVKNAVLLLNYKIKKTTSSFNVTYGQDLPQLEADQQKLEQVFVNLIGNALEALPDKRKAVSIETRYEKEKREIEVKIRDEGEGIPQAIVSRIMDPFFTTKRAKGGTGLGLSIAMRIVTLHNGEIRIQSVEGQGSSVIVKLPEARSKTKTMLANGDPQRGAL